MCSSFTRSHSHCGLIQQVRVAVYTGYERREASAQPLTDRLVAPRSLFLYQLQLQLLRVLRHGVTLPGHAVGTAWKEIEENNGH